MEAFALSEVALAEPEVVQTEAPTTQEQPPIDPSDAAESTHADAGAETTTTTEAPLSVDDYVASQLQKEGEQAKPESTREPQVDPETERIFYESAQSFDASAKVRHDAIDTEHEAAVARLMEEGYSKTIAETLVAPLTKAAHDRLNEHHADAKTQPGSVNRALYEERRTMWQGVAAVVPAEHHPEFLQKLNEGKYASHEAIFKDVWAKAASAGETKGYEAGRKAGLTQGYQDGLAQAGKVASLSSDGQQVNGTGGGTGSGSWTTKTQARNLHAQDRISNAEMRRINDDPRIPD